MVKRIEKGASVIEDYAEQDQQKALEVIMKVGYVR
jgi:hypothetical protein